MVLNLRCMRKRTEALGAAGEFKDPGNGLGVSYLCGAPCPCPQPRNESFLHQPQKETLRGELSPRLLAFCK